MKKFTSQIDNCVIDYQIVNGNLSYRTEGTAWQDFILDDKAQELADKAQKSDVCIPIGEGENCW